MRIEIDTKTDSKEDLIAVFRLLESLLGEERQVYYRPPYPQSRKPHQYVESVDDHEPTAHDLAARREREGRDSIPTPPVGIFGMFDNPPAQPALKPPGQEHADPWNEPLPPSLEEENELEDEPRMESY